MFKTILFPVDGSRESREAAELVLNVVKTYTSKLFLLSVVEENKEGSMSSEPEVAKLLQGAKTLFQQQGINAETIEKVGIPSFLICDVADEINADLIIMGCRGLGLTPEKASESVTHRTIELAPCPILIVP